LDSGTAAVNDSANGAVSIGSTGGLRAGALYSTNPIPASVLVNGLKSSQYPNTVVSGAPVGSPYQKLVPPPTTPGVWNGSNVQLETATNWDPSTDPSVHVGGLITQPLIPAIYVVTSGMQIQKGLNGTNGALFYVTGGNVSLGGNGNVALSPLSPNWEQTVDNSAVPTPEVALWISQNDTNATLTLGGNGNTTTITGAVYAPTAALTMNGGGSNGGVNVNTLVLGSISTCNGGGSLAEDFTIGNQAATGTVDAPSQSGILANTPITDLASVAGSITPNYPPTGTVQFIVCGPEDPSLGCASESTKLVAGWNPAPVPLTSSVNSTSTAQSPTFTPTAPGAYCFGAYYSPPTPPGLYSASFDASSNACFNVSQPLLPTITSPTSGPCYAAKSNTPSCGSSYTTWPSDAISGTAPAGTTKITLTVEDAKGNYWNGTKFVNVAKGALPPTVTATPGAPTDWTTWSYPFSTFAPGDTGSYTITATAYNSTAVSGVSQPLTFTWGG
jgi:hypothetical protein